MRKTILLSAFACDPLTGSEPYVGWNWAMMLARDYDVHVLTRAYSRDLIERIQDNANITFHYADYFGASRHNHHWRFIKPYYVVWQFLALFKVMRLHRRYAYQVIHHVTYNNIDVPGFLWLVPGSRFIWGPVGGGQVAPPSLARVYGNGWWKERARGLLKASARYNPIVRCAIHRAAVVLLANQETADRLAGLRFQSALISETAISQDGVSDPAISARPAGPVRILWLAHAFARKGLSLAVEGFSHAARAVAGGTDIELTVVGDGEALPGAKRLAADLGVSDKIAFVGAVPHFEVDRYMVGADIFLFTSVQDTSGNVLLEAMRNAKPIVALNHQGAKALVTEGGGRLVDIGGYDETVRRIGSAIVELAENPDLRRDMGRANCKEVRRRHTWRAKRQQILEIYEAALSRGDERAVMSPVARRPDHGASGRR